MLRKLEIGLPEMGKLMLRDRYGLGRSASTKQYFMRQHRH